MSTKYVTDLSTMILIVFPEWDDSSFVDLEPSFTLLELLSMKKPGYLG